MALSTARFSGLDERILRAGYSLSHGISPGVATIEVPAGTEFKSIQGDLSFFSDLGNITLPDFRIDSVSGRRDKGTILTVSLLDKRWRWKFGHISGHYNLRNSRGKLDEETEKAPRELAKLCLEAMGEQSFDISDLPDSARPAVAWSYANPASALASLCDELGCRVVLQTNGTVTIRKLGEGKELPPIEYGALGAAATLDPIDGPSSFLFVGGKDRYEAVFELEAVIQDEDGKIKKPDDVSFRPAGGWENERPGFFSSLYDDELDDPENKEDNKKETPYDLAHKCFYKWYRIKEDSEIEIVGEDKEKFTVEDMSLLLPLEDTLVETLEEIDPVTRERKPKPALVWGEYYSKSVPYKNEEKGLRGLWRLDRNSGIVIFSQPIYKIIDLEDGALFQPAELKLKCAFSVRDEETREWKRYTKLVRVGGNSQTGPQIIRNETVVRTFEVNGKDNTKEDQIEDKADYYINAAIQEYQVGVSGSASYSGIRKFEPDGAITQVSWEVGKGGPITRISRNNEHDPFVAPYGERRRQEMLDDLLKENAEKKQREANRDE